MFDTLYVPLPVVLGLGWVLGCCVRGACLVREGLKCCTLPHFAEQCRSTDVSVPHCAASSAISAAFS